MGRGARDWQTRRPEKEVTLDAGCWWRWMSGRGSVKAGMLRGAMMVDDYGEGVGESRWVGDIVQSLS